ncbi:MAG: hypothetical protein JKY54_03980 [Flavobacteriales bacterium]|nr:hypothetical protein [Flavobacteriales bacterium]
MKNTLLIGIITLMSSTTFSQENPFSGQWTLVSNERKNYHIHDTINLASNGSFTTSTVPGTMNSGTWKPQLFKRNNLKLNACLHSTDNLNKCREFKWTWQVTEIDNQTMNIIQTSKISSEEIKLTYKKLK